MDAQKVIERQIQNLLPLTKATIPISSESDDQKHSYTNFQFLAGWLENWEWGVGVGVGSEYQLFSLSHFIKEIIKRYFRHH